LVKMINGRTKFRWLVLLLALETIVALVWLALIPPDPKSALLWGYSLSRLLLMAGALGLLAVTMLALAKPSRWAAALPGLAKQLQADQKPYRAMQWLLLALSLVLLWFVFAPFAAMGNDWVFATRLRPLAALGLLLLVKVVLALYWLGAPADTTAPSNIPPRIHPVWFISALSLLLVVWLLVALSGIGIRDTTINWYEAGVPVLWSQVLLVLGITVICGLLYPWLAARQKPTWHPNRWEIGLLVVLWLLTTLWLVLTPVRANYFAPGPYPPTYELFPYSDAAAWDIGGYAALYGQGIFQQNPSRNVDHTAYAAFLALLHQIVGHNYEALLALQAAALAAFVPLLYLLGKRLRGRTLGMALAAIGMLRMVNAVRASAWINTSHASILMTEVPAMVVIALLLWALLQALQQQEINLRYGILAGAAMALLLLIRLNSLVAILAILAFVLLLAVSGKKKAGLLLLVMGLSWLVALAPWMVRSYQVAGSPWAFLGKASYLFDPTFRMDTIGARSAGQAYLASASPARPTQLLPDEVAAPAAAWASTARAIGEHFAHNLITSVMVLPLSPVTYDLELAIFTSGPYWNKTEGRWTGTLSLAHALGLLGVLALLALGIAESWQRWSLVGLLPLVVFGAYHLSTAIVRTSGGRYLVPVDWILLLYYLGGLLWLWQRLLGRLGLVQPPLAQALFTPRLAPGRWQGLPLAVGILLFMVYMYGIDQWIAPTYAPVPPAWEQAVWDEQPGGADARLEGYLLYPRFYYRGQGESGIFEAYLRRGFDRFAFTVVMPEKQIGQVIFPTQEVPENIAHGQTVIVQGQFIDPQRRLLMASLLYFPESGQWISVDAAAWASAWQRLDP